MTDRDGSTQFVIIDVLFSGREMSVDNSTSLKNQWYPTRSTDGRGERIDSRAEADRVCAMLNRLYGCRDAFEVRDAPK